jgi:hypothetical protein
MVSDCLMGVGFLWEDEDVLKLDNGDGCIPCIPRTKGH